LWSVEEGTTILTRQLVSWMRKRKAQCEHQYFRGVITYTDGETSANRVFKDKTRAEEFAARQKKSLTVKSATLKPFMRDAYNAPKVRKDPKPPSR
jgi:hypothetical protein